MRIGNTIGPDKFARMVVGGMGLIFTGTGVTTMKTAPNPGVKLFGAGFATIGTGLLMLAGSKDLGNDFGNL